MKLNTKRIIILWVVTLLVASFAFAQEDHSHTISPDGTQIIFINYVKPCPITSDTGWFPADYDEIWSMNVDGSNKRCIIKNNYSEMQDIEDYKNYLGSFDSLYFSPDGKKIYFLCQNCTVDAILYIANADGSDIRRISNAHQLDMVGGSSKDEYYGYLVAGVRKSRGAKPIRWTIVLMDPEGNEIKEIDDLDEFWMKHERM